MRCFQFVAASAFAIAVSSPAFAQQSCLGALIQDKGSLDSREASSLALARLIDRSSSSEGSSSGGIKVPIKGVPVAGSFEQLKKQSDDYFEDSKLDWTQERLVSVATQTLSARSVEAYKACVDGDRSGPRITVFSATPSQATVRIKWIAPVGAPASTKNVSISTSGGAFKGKFPATWRSGESFDVILNRRIDQDLRIAANIGGEGANEFVSRSIPIPSRPRRLVVGSCVGRGGQDGVRLWGPSGATCNDIQDWGRYDSQVQAVTELGSCIGHGGFEGVRLYGPVGQLCGGIAPWGVYSAPASVMTDGIASCIGHGNVLEGHRLWGPTGERCGGMDSPGWGSYSEHRRLPE